MIEAKEVTVTLSSSVVAVLCQGWSAKKMRSAGIRVPDSTPDCAVLTCGRFEWVTVDIACTAAHN